MRHAITSGELSGLNARLGMRYRESVPRQPACENPPVDRPGACEGSSHCTSCRAVKALVRAVAWFWQSGIRSYSQRRLSCAEALFGCSAKLRLKTPCRIDIVLIELLATSKIHILLCNHFAYEFHPCFFEAMPSLSRSVEGPTKLFGRRF
jgi:hypothetical protein